jgi:hypothetical protein
MKARTQRQHTKKKRLKQAHELQNFHNTEPISCREIPRHLGEDKTHQAAHKVMTIYGTLFQPHLMMGPEILQVEEQPFVAHSSKTQPLQTPCPSHLKQFKRLCKEHTL